MVCKHGSHCIKHVPVQRAKGEELHRRRFEAARPLSFNILLTWRLPAKRLVSSVDGINSPPVQKQQHARRTIESRERRFDGQYYAAVVLMQCPQDGLFGLQLLLRIDLQWANNFTVTSIL